MCDLFNIIFSLKNIEEPKKFFISKDKQPELLAVMEVASFFEEERRGKDITDSATSLGRNTNFVALRK